MTCPIRERTIRLPALVIEPGRSVSPELRQPGVRPKKFAKLRPCGNRSIGAIRQAIARAIETKAARDSLPREPQQAGRLEELERQVMVLVEQVEDREIDLAHSDRSKTPIEPYLADQWFVAILHQMVHEPGRF